MIQIDPVPAEAWESPVRSVRRKMSRTNLRIRVRSEGRKPVWAEVPMVMHRPLPAGGDIRGASLICEKVAGKMRYKVVITVALPDHEIAEEGQYLGVRPSVGVDIGWRLKSCGGIRVAYWSDENDRHGEVLLPYETVSQFRKLEDLRSIRDQHFNEAKQELQAFLSENNVPDWVAEQTKHIDKWRSTRRLLSIVNNWTENRFQGDEEIFDKMLSWKEREIHLYSWEANLRDQITRRRREIYRIFAAWVSREYGQVFLEDFDLSKVKKNRNQRKAQKHPCHPQEFAISLHQEFSVNS